MEYMEYASKADASQLPMAAKVDQVDCSRGEQYGKLREGGAAKNGHRWAIPMPS